jgi:hypothetical protein
MSVENTEKREHISKHYDTAYANGLATYACPNLHQGMPNNKFITGSRKEIRKHIMTKHKSW